MPLCPTCTHGPISPTLYGLNNPLGQDSLGTMAASLTHTEEPRVNLKLTMPITQVPMQTTRLM